MKSPLKVPSLIITSGAIRAAQVQQLSIARLLNQAERLYLARDTARLSQVADELSSIAHPGARAARDFYRAMVLYRSGDSTNAWPLIVSASECKYAPRYQARAIQAIGIEYQNAGDHTEAIRVYNDAVSAARLCGDAVAFVRAGFQFSELKSKEGDHSGALDCLRLIRPAVEVLGKAEPFYLHLFSNEVAFELLQNRRIEEARRFAQFAISSPVVLAYPEWLETAQEVEQQAREKAARNQIVRPAVEQARKTSPKPKLRLVKKPCPVALPAPTRRRTGPVAIIRPEQPRSRPTLEQLCLKVRIRAPSF